MNNKSVKNPITEDLYNYPDNYFPINEQGDFYIRCLLQNYAAKRMMGNIPIFEKAYTLLTELSNTSSKNKFGEMHADGYLWIEKTSDPTVRVIVEQRQSRKVIYIHTGDKFHIRALSYSDNYPPHRKNELKHITVEKFRKQNFKPNLKTGFSAFAYGDGRDAGYVISLDLFIQKLMGRGGIDLVNDHTLRVIDGMSNWEFYLDNVDELE